MKSLSRTTFRHLAGAIAIGLAIGAAHAGTLNLATGLDSMGQLQTTGDALDANWQVLGGANPLMTPNAYVVGANSADQGFCCGWIANRPDSSWIAANPDDLYGNGYMTFIRTFWVSTPGTASIVGAWTIDDAGTLALNGNALSNLPFDSWSSLHPFSTVPSDFVYGWNTLVMAVTYSDIDRDGGRLQGTLINTSVPTIPETSTWAMMLLGFAGLGYVGYRKARPSVSIAA